jgi:hypothetical protein
VLPGSGASFPSETWVRVWRAPIQSRVNFFMILIRSRQIQLEVESWRTAMKFRRVVIACLVSAAPPIAPTCFI